MNTFPSLHSLQEATAPTGTSSSLTHTKPRGAPPFQPLTDWGPKDTGSLWPNRTSLGIRCFPQSPGQSRLSFFSLPSMPESQEESKALSCLRERRAHFSGTYACLHPTLVLQCSDAPRVLRCSQSALVLWCSRSAPSHVCCCASVAMSSPCSSFCILIRKLATPAPQTISTMKTLAFPFALSTICLSDVLVPLYLWLPLGSPSWAVLTVCRHPKKRGEMPWEGRSAQQRQQEGMVQTDWSPECSVSPVHACGVLRQESNPDCWSAILNVPKPPCLA